MTKGNAHVAAAAAHAHTNGRHAAAASHHHAAAPSAAAASSSPAAASSLLKSASAPSASSVASAIPSGLRRYLKLEKLGEGNYGCVYKARDRVSGNLVALKKIKLDDEDDGVPSTALREVAILQDCVHPNIVKLEEVILEGKQLYLVFEFLDLDLRRYLDNILGAAPAVPVASFPTPGSAGCPPIKGLPMNLVKSYTYQLLEGVEHMHSHRHLHRDLKPQNLLIDRKGRMQIADLGLARAISAPMPKVTHEVATLWYRPPEILLGSEPYSSPVDLWSIGCILAEMISLAPSFPGDSEIDTLFKIFQALGTPTPESWPGVDSLKDWHTTFPKWARPSDAQMCHALHIRPQHHFDAEGIDLLRQLLTLNPAERISARKAKEHPWFTRDKLANMPSKARSKLEAHAAKVAEEAATRAQQRKKEKADKKAQAKREARARGEDDGADEAGAESEEYEEDELPIQPAAATAAAEDRMRDEQQHEEEDEEEDDASAHNTSASSVSSSSP